jgi:replicative DNA helicase
MTREEEFLSYGRQVGKRPPLKIVPLHGKRPFMDDWGEKGSSDPAQIGRWMRDHPGCNFGILTGMVNGIIVIDVDIKHYAGKYGDETLEALQKELGPLPDTPQAITGSGGMHYVFKYPQGATIKNSVGIAPGIDIRSDGGQIVAAPSIHPETKRPYSWNMDYDWEEMEPADLPKAWLDWIIRGGTKAGEPASRFELPESIPTGERNDTLFRYGCSLRAKGMKATAIEKAMSWANDNRCHPPLSGDELETVYNQAMGYKYTPREGQPETGQADYKNYVRETCGRLDDPAAVEYLSRVGVSLETAKKAHVGFDSKADPAETGHLTPRLIFPTSHGQYTGMSIDPWTAPEYKTMHSKGHPAGIFNERALKEQVVFVVMTPVEALQIMEAGHQAIGLQSAANASRLAGALDGKTGRTFILCLDPQMEGQAKAAQAMRDELGRIGAPYISWSIDCDPAGDPGGFSASLEEATRRAGKRPDNVTAYIDSFMGRDIELYRDVRKTGFYNLDMEAGGLYNGFYVLGGGSSLGKTTFACQMADQLAANGHDVIYFSLEQSRLEMVSKSLSRIMAPDMGKEPGSFFTSLQIRRGERSPHLLDAVQRYRGMIGDRLSIVEGNFNVDADYIAHYVRQYMDRNGTRPVVFIDYLQILQPPAMDAKKGGQTTKQAIDTTVTALKQLSRECNIPVVVISSLNRTNYLLPFDFESLKESGNIEYTADVVWGLQLSVLDEDLFTKDAKIKEKRQAVEEAKSEMPRKIKLVCKKNRYGKSNYNCYFSYYPDRDLFREATGGPAAKVTTAKRRA